ncbi:MAG TPA: amidohydrolase family protein [Acidimicrobiales bacterium]|nr:amidohydrolase family protein [Acidimicrobiales bacterium]
MLDTKTLETIKVIDSDTHVTEPPDLWTSRMSEQRFGDAIPRVVVDPETKFERWKVGEHVLGSPAFFAYAGWKNYPPQFAQRLSEVDPGSFDAKVRLERMDEYGVHAQVLYPNLIGFSTTAFMSVSPEFALAATQAYNDFLVEFASADPARFVPIMMVPFWDIDAAVAEMKRCRETGHKGILFANCYEKIGLPDFTQPHWDPIYKAAADLDFPVNFHVGFSDNPTDGMSMDDLLAHFESRSAAMFTSLSLMSNANTLARLLTSGLLDRFPMLKFVSVESGLGYVPYLLENLDWHWKGYGAYREYPTLPSEYYARQCYGSFWFEKTTLPLLELYPDNFMFETDYPHPTSLSPGPASPADNPAEHIAKGFVGRVSTDTARKALRDNAVKVYGL